MGRGAAKMSKCDDDRRIPRRGPLPAPPLPTGSRTLPLLLLLLFFTASITSSSDAVGLSPLRDARAHHHQQQGYLPDERRRGSRRTERGDVDARRYLRYSIPNTVGRKLDGEDEDPDDRGFEIPAILEVRERDCEEQFRKQRLVELDEYVTYIVLAATEYIVSTAAEGEVAGAESSATKQTGQGAVAADVVTDIDDRDDGLGGGWNVTALRDEWNKSEEGTSSDKARHWQDFAEQHALDALPMLPDGTLRTFAGYACRYTRRRKDKEIKEFCRRYEDEGGINVGSGADSVLKELPGESAIRLASVDGKSRRRRLVKELCLDPFSSYSTYSPSSTSVEGDRDRDEAVRRRWDEIVDAMTKYYVDEGLIVASTIIDEGEQEQGVGQGEDNATETVTVNVGVNGSTTVAAMEVPPFTMMLLLRPSTVPSDSKAVVNATILAGEASAMLSDVLWLHHNGNGTSDSIPSSPPLNGSGSGNSNGDSFPTPGDDSPRPGRPEFLGVNLTASIMERDAADHGQNENENSGNSAPSLILPSTEVVATLRGTAYYQRGDGDSRGATGPVNSTGEMRERVKEAFGADGGSKFVSRYLRLSSDEILRRVKRIYVRHTGE